MVGVVTSVMVDVVGGVVANVVADEVLGVIVDVNSGRYSGLMWQTFWMM